MSGLKKLKILDISNNLIQNVIKMTKKLLKMNSN